MNRFKYVIAIILFLAITSIMSFSMYRTELNKNKELLSLTQTQQATEATEDTILFKAETSASLGNINNAKELFENIIDYNPFAVQAYTGLASVLIQQEKIDEAQGVIDLAIEQMPENAELYKVRGGIKYLTDDKIGAAEDMKKSLELAPNESDKLTGEYTNFINKC